MVRFSNRFTRLIPKHSSNFKTMDQDKHASEFFSTHHSPEQGGGKCDVICNALRKFQENPRIRIRRS